MEACINKGLAEVEPFSICMEYIGSAALFKMHSHVLECRKQELIEVVALNRIVLDRKSVGAFKGDSVRRVCQDKVCFLIAHQLINVLCLGGIAAHKTVPANRPHITGFYEGRFFECFR